MSEQAYQIEAQAESLEASVRSGGRDAVAAVGSMNDITDGAQRLDLLLNEYMSQPGITNAARRQADRIRISVAEIRAFASGAAQNLDPHSMAIHAEGIFASTANIIDRRRTIHTLVRSLAGENQ